MNRIDCTSGRVISPWRGGIALKIAGIVCLLIVFASAQESILNFDSTRTGRVGTQAVVTPNQLRAPRKAKEAMMRAQNAIRAHNFSEARKQIARALEVYPNYAFALNARGILNILDNNVEEGTNDLRKAIEADPSMGPPYAILASLNNDNKNYDDALILAEKSVQLLSWAWQSHIELARAIFGKASDDVQAFQEVVEAERLASGSGPGVRSYIHYFKGLVLLQMKSNAAAKIEFGQAMKADPDGKIASDSKREIERLNNLEARVQGPQLKESDGGCQSVCATSMQDVRSDPPSTDDESK